MEFAGGYAAVHLVDELVHWGTLATLLMDQVGLIWYALDTPVTIYITWKRKRFCFLFWGGGGEGRGEGGVH